MIIRACHPSDIPEIADIYRHAVLTGTASFEIEPPDPAEMGTRHAALVGGGYPYLVAARHGRLAGYAYAGPYRARPAYRATVENSVYVAPDAQRAGIGRALLAALVDATAERGFRQMVAVIGDSGNLPSIRLHESAGFAHAGVLRAVGWKHGRWLDSVLMQRAVGPGASEPSRAPADA